MRVKASVLSSVLICTLFVQLLVDTSIVVAATSTNQYAALGDSYSAGEGVEPFLSDSGDCHRSNKAYSQLFAASYGYAAGNVKFVACSGAVTEDFFSQNHSNPSENPQLSALNSSTKLVTFSIGGNDLGFAKIVKACAHFWVISGDYGCKNRSDLIAELDGRSAALRGIGSAISPDGTEVHSLLEVIRAVSARAPNAHVVVVGYPKLFGSDKSRFRSEKSAPSGAVCDAGSYLGTSFSIDFNDAQWMNAWQGALNTLISDAVFSAQGLGLDIAFANPTTWFQGHGFCDSSTRWFYQIADGGHGATWPGAFHPTEVGQAGYYANLKNLVAPTVKSMTPNSGSLAGGTRVTIKGTNLETARTVLFGDAIGEVQSASKTQVVALSPLSRTSGLVRVRVGTIGGLSASVPGGFTYPQSVKIAASGDHTCAISSAGSLKCWGSGFFGETGDGLKLDRYLPTQVSGMTSGVVRTAIGENFSCALSSRGVVSCWGANGVGQLGDGTLTDRSKPVQVSGISGAIRQINSESDNSCAISTIGQVFCWGSNSYGQTGSGNTTTISSAIAVTSLTSGASAIAVGGAHTCAVLDAGVVKCWGNNFQGQLGDGTFTNRLAPVSVAGLGEPAIGVAAGAEFSCALLSNRTVKCWGSDWYGELGNGISGYRSSTPVTVSGLTEVVSVTANAAYACAVRKNGEVYCWGGNFTGTIGDGTEGNTRPTPVQIFSAAQPVLYVVTGHWHACALLASGVTMCWGTNGHGQFGNGSTTKSLLPTVVNWVL